MGAGERDDEFLETGDELGGGAGAADDDLDVEGDVTDVSRDLDDDEEV